MTDQLVNAVNSGMAWQQPAQAPAPAPQPAQYGPSPNGGWQQMSGYGAPFGPPDPDLAIRDPAAWQQQYDAYITARQQEQLAQVALPVMTTVAATARDLSRMDPEAGKVWQKYGPEIDALVAAIPVWQRSKATYDQAAKIVRANHVNDLVQEELDRARASGGFGTEPAGSGSAAPSAPSERPLDKLFADNHPHVQRLKDAGLTTPERVREFLPRMGRSEEDFVNSILQAGISAEGRGVTAAPLNRYAPSNGAS